MATSKSEARKTRAAAHEEGLSITQTCRKLNDLHVEVKKRELKRFDERAR